MYMLQYIVNLSVFPTLKIPLSLLISKLAVLTLGVINFFIYYRAFKGIEIQGAGSSIVERGRQGDYSEVIMLTQMSLQVK